jgi:hypothetical protein
VKIVDISGKTEYLKEIINKLGTNSKNITLETSIEALINLSIINYLNRTNIKILEFPHSHVILNRLKNYLCSLLSVHSDNGMRQTDIHTFMPTNTDCGAE